MLIADFKKIKPVFKTIKIILQCKIFNGLINRHYIYRRFTCVDLLVLCLCKWCSVIGIHTWCGCVQSWVSVWLWPFTLCLQLYETGAKDHGKRALNIPSVFEAYKKDCQGHRNTLSLLFSLPLTAAMLVTVITKPNLLKYVILKTFVWLTGWYFTILA